MDLQLDRQAGDRHGRQQGHRQGRGADAGRRGLRRRRSPPAPASTLEETAVEIAAATGRARHADHRRHRRGRVGAGAGGRRPPSALGGVDILVNSAAKPLGQSPPPKLADVTGMLFWDDMNVKVLGYLRCAQAVAPR